MSTKVYFINSSLAEYNDAEFAWFQSLMLREGVVGDADTGVMGLEVTENASPDMSVLVSAGKALVEITKSTGTFKVVAENDASAQLVVTANTSGSNRVDAVIIRVDVDAEPNALKTNIVTLQVIAGSGTSPLADAAIDSSVGDDGWYRLANIVVPNATSDITDSDISDTRDKVMFSDGMSFDEIFVASSAGAADEDKVPSLDNEGTLDETFYPNYCLQDIEYGEDIDAGEAVFIPTENTVYSIIKDSAEGSSIYTFDNATSAIHKAQVYTSGVVPIKLRALTLKHTRSGSSTSGTFTVKVHAVDGSNKPTGAALGTATFTMATVGSTYGVYVFGSDISIAANTKFAVVISYSGVDSNNQDVMGGTSNVNIAKWTSSDSGSTWTSEGVNDIFMVLHVFYGTKNKAYLTQANIPVTLVEFAGWAKTTAAAGADGKIISSRDVTMLSGLTGLTDGSTYYLSDTPGAMSTSAGTYKFPVGVAEGTTKIRLRRKPYVDMSAAAITVQTYQATPVSGTIILHHQPKNYDASYPNSADWRVSYGKPNANEYFLKHKLVASFTPTNSMFTRQFKIEAGYYFRQEVHQDLQAGWLPANSYTMIPEWDI